MLSTIFTTTAAFYMKYEGINNLTWDNKKSTLRFPLFLILLLLLLYYLLLCLYDDDSKRGGNSGGGILSLSEPLDHITAQHLIWKGNRKVE